MMQTSKQNSYVLLHNVPFVFYLSQIPKLLKIFFVVYIRLCIFDLHLIFINFVLRFVSLYENFI